MLCVVALLLHVFPLAALDVSTTFPPWQKVVGPPAVIVTAGAGLTVTLTAEDVPPHPLLSVTVYDPDAVTVMLCVVAPLLHTLLLLMLEVSSTLSPWQNVVGPPAAIEGMLFGFTLTVTAFEVPVHPLTSVTDAEYVPAALTVMLWDVALLLHVFPVTALDVSTTLPPWQKVVGPPAVTVTDGLLFTVTATELDAPVHPFASVTDTE